MQKLSSVCGENIVLEGSVENESTHRVDSVNATLQKLITLTHDASDDYEHENVRVELEASAAVCAHLQTLMAPATEVINVKQELLAM